MTRSGVLLLLCWVACGCSDDPGYKVPKGVIVAGKVLKGGQPLAVPRADVGFGMIEVALVPENAFDDAGFSRQLGALQGVDRLLGILGRHLDKAEAARAPGLAVGRQHHRHDLAILRKELTHIVFARAKGEIPHVDPLIQAFTPRRAEPTNAASTMW